MSPFAYSRSATNLTWQDTHSSKTPQTKDFLLKPAKANIEIPSSVTMPSNDSDIRFTSKALATKSISPGCLTSFLIIEPHDFAFRLLHLSCRHNIIILVILIVNPSQNYKYCHLFWAEKNLSSKNSSM